MTQSQDGGDGRGALAFEDAAFLWRDELRGDRLALEFKKADLILRDAGIRSTVVVFGSARAQEGITDGPLAGVYEQARRFAAALARDSLARRQEEDGHPCLDYVVCTGGGPGVMEAANRGARDAGAPSIGLNITLPLEQLPNPYQDDRFKFQFRYFAVRKMHFMMRARALVYFPGGYGTLDELFGALTLIQTGKMQRVPVLLMQPDYWRRVLNIDALVEAGALSAEEARIPQFMPSIEEALAAILPPVSAHEGELAHDREL